MALNHARQKGQPLEIPACRERIATYLHEQVRRRAISQHIRLLAGQRDIAGFDFDAAESLLVQ